MKYMLFTVLLMFQSLAWAGANGKWIGWGYWNYEGSGARCDISLRFIETKTYFQRVGGYFDCSVVGMELPELKMEKKGQDLLLNGEVVGKINGDQVEYKEKYSETVSVETKIQVDGRHLDYQEYWYEKDGDLLYEITGRVFLSE